MIAFGYSTINTKRFADVCSDILLGLIFQPRVNALLMRTAITCSRNEGSVIAAFRAESFDALSNSSLRNFFQIVA